MTISTISGTTTVGINLTSPTFADPVTVTSTGKVSGPDDGIISFSAWTIQNYGTVTGNNGYGIELRDGGYVTNGLGGSISGVKYGGIYVNGGYGTVDNAGSINGQTFFGVNLKAGGSVSNANGGSITGAVDGVYVNSGFGSVYNSGSIVGASKYGVYMRNQGRVTNTSGGFISGYGTGVAINGRGTVENAGTIMGLNRNGFGTFSGNGIAIGDRGYVSNAAGGLISGYVNGVDISIGPSTVNNAGTIITTGSDGIYMHPVFSYGYVTNQSGGLISGGQAGVVFDEGTGTIDNAGSITATASGGSPWTGDGVVLFAGGYITNAAGGSISGTNSGVFLNGLGTIENAGTIVGTAGSGIYTYGANSISNGKGDLISGGQYGILVKGSSITIENAGTIAGGTDAIDFAESGTNRLIVDGGAVFNGNVVAKSGGANSIELTSTDGPGTLSGLGSKFTGFKGVLFDANTQWKVAGSFAGINWLSGFRGRDTLDLTSIAYSAGNMAVLAGGNVLEVVNSSSSVLWQVSLGSASYAGLDFVLAPDGSGDTTLSVDTPPTLTVPGAQTVTGGANKTITGIKVTDAYASAYGEAVTVVVSDISGLLSATAHGAMLSGLGTTQLTLSGTLTQVDAALASLTYAATKPGSDTISLSVSAPGGAANGTIAVTANSVVTSWTFAGLANWGTAADWSNGKVPNDGLTIATIAIAGGKAQISTGQSYAVDTLDVDNATAQLILGGKLTSVSGVTVQAGFISLKSGTLMGSLSLASGTTLGGIGMLGGTVSNSGQINDNGGALTISGDVTGTGSLQIFKASTLELGGNAAGQTINFVAVSGAPAETLVLDNPSDQFGKISGFAEGDTMDLKGLVADSHTWAGGVLTLFDGTTEVDTLTVAGNFTGLKFVLTGDQHGGTDITLTTSPNGPIGTPPSLGSSLSAAAGADATGHGPSTLAIFIDHVATGFGAPNGAGSLAAADTLVRAADHSSGDLLSLHART